MTGAKAMTVTTGVRTTIAMVVTEDTTILAAPTLSATVTLNPGELQLAILAMEILVVKHVVALTMAQSPDETPTFPPTPKTTSL